MGWSLSKDLTSGVFSREGIFQRTFIGNINLYAVWEYGTEGLFYELNSENKYEVTSYYYNEIFDPNIKLVIPSKHNNIEVVAIRSQVFMNYRENIESLVLCEGLKRIDDDAFYEFKKIKSITIPKSVEFIGRDAFLGCELLETINFNAISCNNENTAIFTYSGFESNGIDVVIGNQVKLLPRRFLDTSYGKQLNINSIEFENNSVCEEIGERALPILGISNISLPKNLKRIQNYAFAYSSIEQLHLPEGILYIGEKAFINNVNLQSIYIPKSLDQIAGSVFESCPMLVIYLEINSVPEWWNASWNIENLPIVLDYKNNDVALDGNVYFSYQGLRYVYNNGNVTYIKQFVPNGLVNIPNTVIFHNQEKNVTAIETDAFNNTSIKEITLPDFLTVIDSNLFYQCSLLEKVVLGKNTIKLGDLAFYGCTNLTKIIGSEQILEVGNGTFKNCSSLQEIKLPKIKTIKSCLFYECSSLVNIEFSTELTKIEDNAFENCGITNIVLPTTLTYIGNSAFSRAKLQSIVLPNSVENLGTNVFLGCAELTNVVLPDNLKILPMMTFYQCYKLFNVVLPSFLESTERNCFYSTAITNIKFSSTLKILGDETFEECHKLISVDCSSATSIGFRAFSNCTSLKEVKLGKELKDIGGEAFYRCIELKSLIISDSVDYIGESAFGRCDNITLYFESSRYKSNWKYSGFYSSPQEVFSCVLAADKSYVISFTKNYLYDDYYRPLNSPKREGYTFGGWYNSPNFVTEIKDLTNYPKDSKVYIKWISNELQ